MAMRTTTHHGRGRGGKGYGKKHNDRNFDVKQADNIDVELVSKNEYWCIYEGLTFEAAELKFYKEKFGEQLQATNDKYVANRHPERCKTMAQWMKVKQNAPEESHFQIGKKHDEKGNIIEDYVKAAELKKVYKEFEEFEKKWNEDHGKPFTLLNVALHVDEPGCPDHIQRRKVWHYTAADGTLKIGQERALEAAGVELPNPDKKESRYNNRKMTYDKMMRDKWLELCEKHGIEVEKDPLPTGKGKKSKTKEEYIREKFEQVQAEAEALKAENAQLTDENAQLKDENKELVEEQERIRSEIKTTIKSKEEYDEAVSSLTDKQNGFLHLVLDVFVELREAYNSPDDSVWKAASERFKNVIVAFEHKILNLMGYEVKENLPEEERHSKSFQETVDSIVEQAQGLSEGSDREPIDFDLEM